MNRIRVAENSDWECFVTLAAAEGWRVPQVEHDLFRGPWRTAARALVDNDRCCGLVTAVAHQRSGWIGNLLVPVDRRGRGYGTRLFEAALEVLQDRGVSSIWLTASEAGRPLYEKYGFAVTDRIERWVLAAPLPGTGPAETCPNAEAQLHRADRAAWGEQRSGLLNALTDRGRVFASDDAVALLQQDQVMQVIGPWYTSSGCPRANRRLLMNLLAAADPSHEVIIDLRATSPLRPLLTAAGFSPTGSNALMVCGDADDVDRMMISALASLGSLG